MSDTGRSYWERHARNYDRSMSLLGGPMPRVLELTAEAVDGAGTVLEVAAGTGLVTAAIAPRVGTLIATDYADAMVASLRQRVGELSLSNVECQQADLYALSYPPQRFDAVVAANVLHLVPDLQGALRSLVGVLKPEGKLVVPTFCHDETWLSGAVSRVLAVTGFPGQRRFDSASLRQALESAGLSVTRYELVPGLLPIGFVEASRSL
jgi:phosphatidylethanolamine/phosphatidyl-N-methylethanolamine N-methyltransferase